MNYLSKTMLLLLTGCIGFSSVVFGYYLVENIEHTSYAIVFVFLLLIAVSNIVARLLLITIKDL